MTVKLQGIYNKQEAKAVKELKTGDVIMWNYGYTSTVVDPSHAMGYAHLVKPMAMAATVAGADGLMIEVHNNPAKALCDGPQSLTPDQFDDVAKQVFQLRPFACKYDY